MIDAIVTWNVGPGRRIGELARALRTLIAPGDDVVALFELSQRNTIALRLRFGLRWRVFRPRVELDGRRCDVVAMVRRRVPRPEVAVLAHDVEWIGPKAGIRHKGRAHLMLTWPDDRVVLVHRIPGGPSGGTSPQVHGRNREAWEADAMLIGAALLWPTSVAVLGDQNATAAELREEYRKLGLHVYVTNTHVDHGAQRGYPRMHGQRLALHGSDHPAVRWRLR